MVLEIVQNVANWPTWSIRYGGRIVNSKYSLRVQSMLDQRQMHCSPHFPECLSKSSKLLIWDLLTVVLKVL